MMQHKQHISGRTDCDVAPTVNDFADFSPTCSPTCSPSFSPTCLPMFFAEIFADVFAEVFAETFADLFADVWEILPASTKILMGVSNFTLEYWYLLIIALLLVLFGSWMALKNRKVLTILDRVKIKTPLIGNLFIMAYTSQMLRTLGFLIGGGVPLLDGLTTTRETIKNTLYQDFVDKIIKSAKDGQGISYAFLRTDFLPETVKQVIKTGEDSGKLDFVMIKLSDYYDNEMEKQLKLVSTIIEPVALLIMGVVVGFIVMSIVLPIFKLSQAVH